MVPHPAMVEALDRYYREEGLVAFPFVFSVCLLASIAGIVLARSGGQFSKGLGFSLTIMGVGVGTASLIYAVHLAPMHDALAAILKTEPLAYCEKQVAHLEQTRRNFLRTIATDLTLVAVSVLVAAYGRSRRKTVLVGFAVGVMLSFLALTPLEIRNRDRAIAYEGSIRAALASLRAVEGNR